MQRARPSSNIPVLVTLLVGALGGPVHAAPPGGGSAAPDLGAVLQAGEAARQDLESNQGATITLHRTTGMAASVRFPATKTKKSGLAIAGAKSPEDGAAEFLRRFGSAFGLSDATGELRLEESKADQIGMRHLSYKQVYRGVEVYGGELRLHFDAENRIRAVNGTILPALDLSTTPQLDAAAGAAAAIAEVVANPPIDRGSDAPVSLDAAALRAAATKLYVYQDGLAEGRAGPVLLVYEVEVTDGATVREFVFVNAHTGKLVNRFSGIHDGLSRQISEVTLANVVWNETLGHPEPIPAGWAGGTAAQVSSWNSEIASARETYHLIANLTGGTYLSYDGADAAMRTVNNDQTITCPNAHWTGQFTGYCDGTAADDIVAHEWGHAYTEYTHGLIYQWQPGALNESYSDIWGETVDRLNGTGTDLPDSPRTDGNCSTRTPAVGLLSVETPLGPLGVFHAVPAAFGGALPPVAPLQVALVLANDGAAPTSDACSALNPADVTGKLLLADRGTCSFAVKAINAQTAGATGLVVINNVATAPFVMTGSTVPATTIPLVMISQADGALIKAQLGTGPTGALFQGNGDDSFRWLVGEDSPAFGGAIRDMWKPDCFGDPAKTLDPNYVCGTADGGGVHTNSGVPNHGYALLVDGGTFNGQTVVGIGMTKAAHIYWRAQTIYQTLTSGFPEHADALEQACDDLIGQPLPGLSTAAPIGPSPAAITQADCASVQAVSLAVELRLDPSTQCNFRPLLSPGAPALCSDTAFAPRSLFLESFESGLGGFTATNQGVFAGWPSLDWVRATSLPGGRSGSAAFGADPASGDCGGGARDTSGVMRLESPVITIPAGGTSAPRLAFDHYVATEGGWDGGNLRISINGAGYVQVPDSAFTFNPYPSALNSAGAGNTNPLAGQRAFTGTDGGLVYGSWGQSQIDLGRLNVSPGDTVQLRYDMGIDGCGGVNGWYVDDVRVYVCEPAPVVCGDGIVAGGETCDDGGTTPGDGCSAACAVEAGFSCTGQPSTCSTTCGDGIVAGAETCDDGGTTPGDGCSAACAVEAGFSCTGQPSTCSTTCGDGIVAGTETCDDAGTTPGDGCSAACAVEAGFSCTGQPSVCSPLAVCGNGTREGGETCDDGNTTGGDCCSASCQLEACALTAARDAFLLAGRPNQNQGANPWLVVRGAQSASGRDLNRTVLGFDLAGVNPTAVVRAKLVLTVERNQHGWGSVGRSVAAHPLTDDFVEGNGRSASPGTRGNGAGVTFSCASDTILSNSRADCATPWNGGTHAALPSASALHTNALAPGDQVAFDVTAAVRGGVDRWLIRQAVETQRGRVRYHSREAADPALRPRLELEY